MITLTTQLLRDWWSDLKSGTPVEVVFSRWDDGDAFTLTTIGPLCAPTVTKGVIVMGKRTSPELEVVVRLALVGDIVEDTGLDLFKAPDGSVYRLLGEVHTGGQQEAMQVVIADVLPTLATRRATILESGLLVDSKILVIGLGTGGIHVAIELAKSGVGGFCLLDPERLEVGNVSRHHAGVSHVGRRKTLVARDMILETQPEARIETHQVTAGPDSEELLRHLFDDADLVICATDNRQSKLFVNRLSVEKGNTVIYGGAFERAYGGQVLRVRPRNSPCYQCYILTMPEKEADEEISSDAQAERIAYSDRQVSIEPGLSLDVAPIALMVAKLSLQELLIGKETVLHVLDRDFNAPWYFWVNRPEKGTPYANWPPLSEGSEEMTILRWYGVYFDRDLGCPVCGDFLEAARSTYGLPSGDLPEVPEGTDPLSKVPNKEKE